ncbi:MAG: DUF885 domain-containing protein [Candidatus Aminicenantes bacterium]
MKRLCKSFAVLGILVMTAGAGNGFSAPDDMKNLCDEYVSAWKAFYPSRAFSLGFHGSVFYFEDFSQKNIRSWIGYNREVMNTIDEVMPVLSVDQRINARLLRSRILSELDQWEKEAPHKNSPEFYSGYISRAVSRVLDSDILMRGEKVDLILQRLEGIKELSEAGKQMLEDGSPKSTRRSVESLERSAAFLSESLPGRVEGWLGERNPEEFKSACLHAAEEIQSLILFIREKIQPRASLSDSPVLGREAFAHKLKIYTDSDLTPEQLEEMALEEIRETRAVMAETAEDYLRETYPERNLPAGDMAMVKAALKDMEENRPAGEQEYLLKLRRFAQQAEDFVREHKIATIPENQTLSIELAPESAGAMARIGYVRPAPPFSPNPWTTWFLANIPDSFPEKEREDFWRSFNYHFKKFIVIHELFPGHYIQSKLTRENPHPVRILFPYGLYSEGWATLCERVALEAGWDDGNKLTRLAQLRKRLENANRAYTSVQVHCRGWDEEQILAFSVETSLLAPQFAKSLWGRLMSSPMQITSYFLGYQKLDEIYEAEKKRLGPKFKTLEFMDTILRAGPIPIDEFPAIFANRRN